MIDFHIAHINYMKHDRTKQLKELQHRSVSVQQRGGDSSSGLRSQMIEFGDDVGGEFARNRRQKFGNETDRNKGENVFRIMSLERRKIIFFIWCMK